MHLTPDQHGCYILLRIHCWSKGGVSDNDATLRSVTKCEQANWARNKPVLRELFSVKDGMWRHIETEKSKAEAEARAEANKKRTEPATAARWTTEA